MLSRPPNAGGKEGGKSHPIFSRRAIAAVLERLPLGLELTWGLRGILPVGLGNDPPTHVSMPEERNAVRTYRPGWGYPQDLRPHVRLDEAGDFPLADRSCIPSGH